MGGAAWCQHWWKSKKVPAKQNVSSPTHCGASQRNGKVSAVSLVSSSGSPGTTQPRPSNLARPHQGPLVGEIYDGCPMPRRLAAAKCSTVKR
jgi:hypothetical protein